MVFSREIKLWTFNFKSQALKERERKKEREGKKTHLEGVNEFAT